ncbi:sugar phosphate isomerase/epimerase family protein [Microbacterium oleivorans]|uniref:Sugar phosphate isomerase/epimerase n=1 Tax=Microbacterium oleivorans TaxID=273677 RepID=A0A4R5YS62_9MICO|nr:TIM barrel protein [Microbacterium oleivorans]TDL46197.1 sugar phosphate isomerase/epimerase [Microbacterium oleivorans]
MIGLGTYAFFWEHSDRSPDPLSLVGAFERTCELGVELFQICDYDPLTEMSDREVGDAARAARELGLRIELGTKGLGHDHLERFLALAEAFDARLVRSMVFGPDSRPTLAEAGALLRGILPSYESAGVTLALETYEQVATDDLLGLVRDAHSTTLGICLDPANVVARLESPRTCVEQTAAAVVNVHAKDFAFDRQPGWVGFTYSGARMGTGLHDYRHLLDTVRPRERGINEIVEHWLPWQGDPETTIRTEREWTRATLDHLRSFE